VLVGTIEGVVSIERDATGPGWRVARRALTDKHIHALLLEPESGTLFAGASHGSIFASSDGGETWEARDKGLTEHNIYSLACARLADGVRVFAGTEPAHLFFSDDLGHRWAELPAFRSVDTSRWTFPAPPNVAQTFRVIPGMDDDVHRTLINPLNPDRVYITTGIGMYVSSDGGKTWEQWTDLGHEIGGYPDLLVLHPRRPELMFVASAQKGPGSWRRDHFAGSRISRSTDGGKTWEVLLNRGLPDRLRTAFEAMCLEDWGESFSLFAATATGEVWCSDDGGEHWNEVVSGLAPISKGNHYAAFVTT